MEKERRAVIRDELAANLLVFEVGMGVLHKKQLQGAGKENRCLESVAIACAYRSLGAAFWNHDGQNGSSKPWIE